MSVDTVLAAIGGLSVIFMLYRTNLVLAQDFPEDDKVVMNPLGHAVDAAIDFNKFKEQNWRGFDALHAALRFRTFYQRFTPVICPRDAKLFAVGMLGLFVAVIIVAQLTKADPKVNGIIGAVAASVNLLWWAIIEHGRALKRSVDKLRVQ